MVSVDVVKEAMKGWSVFGGTYRDVIPIKDALDIIITPGHKVLLPRLWRIGNSTKVVGFDRIKPPPPDTPPPPDGFATVWRVVEPGAREELDTIPDDTPVIVFTTDHQ